VAQLSAAAVKRSAAAVPSSAVPARSSALDSVRGLAIVLMILDHLALYAYGMGWGNDFLDGFRLTITRFSMPLFFLVAGHLAWGKQLRLRHAGIAVIGILLPLYVTPIDNPNVLFWWAVGCLCLAVTRWAGWPAWVMVAFALTGYANHWTSEAGGYEGMALFGLMALGALLPRDAFAFGSSMPPWVAGLGRRPLSIYVGHLVALHTLFLVVT
jgi:hypothetical protein